MRMRIKGTVTVRFLHVSVRFTHNNSFDSSSHTGLTCHVKDESEYEKRTDEGCRKSALCRDMELSKSKGKMTFDVNSFRHAGR
jgi:hypothetical protein